MGLYLKKGWVADNVICEFDWTKTIAFRPIKLQKSLILVIPQNC